MSHVEKRNLTVFVVAIAALLAGGALLANRTGILWADAQEESKVGCAGEGQPCAVTAGEAAGFPTVNASVESVPASACGCGEKHAASPAVMASVDAAPAGGCCSADKAAGCDSCGDKDAGCADCADKDAGCADCGDKDGGCGGCSQEPLPASSVEPTGCGCGSAPN